MQAGTTYSAVVGGILKQLRDEKGIDQRTMAEAMGVTQAGWSKLESGKSVLSTVQLAKAAAILGVQTKDVVEYADATIAKIKDGGMEVTYDNKEADNLGLMLLGGAAIGALIAAIIMGKK